ncbi:hypothetical protein [Xenorhabdus bovienii]|uniref:hypothetical protein n=1 Tax=Xenorhabdus bovienii TaxID=40576 RepID=UPI00237CEA1D|nr:hypothetical protein [Xenorhabdus bovienii]MDE1475910.1 hypothetical protein [Xenorhabdus bovienii]MDE9463103.1 hypothetical protein [Xenorhabdus bovienii]
MNSGCIPIVVIDVLLLAADRVAQIADVYSLPSPKRSVVMPVDFLTSEHSLLQTAP